METLLRLDELMRDIQRGGPANDEYLVLTVDRASARQVWAVIFSLALREAATSVHYHPWNVARPLWLTAASTEYAMVPPPQELTEELLSAACGWIAPRQCALGPFGRASQAGRLVVEHGTGQSDWFAVCWSTASGSGVDLYRCAPPSSLDGAGNTLTKTAEERAPL